MKNSMGIDGSTWEITHRTRISINVALRGGDGNG